MIASEKVPESSEVHPGNGDEGGDPKDQQQCQGEEDPVPEFRRLPNVSENLKKS